MRQFLVTPAMGKRLIAKALTGTQAIRDVLAKGTLVIVAGSTNGYVAEEILASTGQAEAFSRKGFRRGTVFPPNFDAKSVAADFPGDVVLTDGAWRKGKTIFDVADDLSCGDVILKGANALSIGAREAAVYIGHPQAGTALATISAVAGRRVRLIVPVGLEKRICGSVTETAAAINAPESSGPRMLPLPGEVFTELDAIEQLSGCKACLVAAGGIYGAEGAVFVGVSGSDEQLAKAEVVIQNLAGEPPCQA